MFVIIKETPTSLCWFYLYFLIMFLQILFLPFYPHYQFPWESQTLVQSITDFLKLFHITFYFSDTSSSTAYFATVYSCMFFVFLIVLDIFYIRYANKRINFQWPLQVLRTSLTLITTILFFPLLELFFSVMHCDKGRHYLFTDHRCWTGIHLLHAAFALATAFLFIVLTFSVVLVFYERKNLVGQGNPLCKVTAKPDFYFLVYLTLQIFLVTFLGEPDY